VGLECPPAFWIGPLTERLNEIRQSIQRSQRILALREELARQAQSWEPHKSRGVPWGATIQEAQTILKAAGDECSDRYAMPGSCSVYRAKIGPVPGVSIFFHFGKTNTFERAILFFPAAQYVVLRGIFVDRYGPPTATKEETLQNRLGATFTNEILQWSGERVWIRLQHYGSKVDTGHAVIALRTVIDREGEEADKARKKGKDDL
jgi:hypothetical protein